MAAGEELEKTAGNLFQQLFGPWVAEQGLIWQENVRVRRLRNQFKILEKVQNIVDENDVKIRDVNLKALAPLLEGIALEEEPTLQEMWVNLTANYLDSSVTSINVVYPHILKSLSTNEVKFLNHLSEHSEFGIHVHSKQPFLEFELHEIHNLERLRLIVEDVKYSTAMDDSREVNWGGTGSFYLTPFGKDFLGACKR